MDLGPVRLQIASDHAHISRGQVASDQSMLLLGLDLPEGRAHMNGIAVSACDMAHLAPGAPLFARVEGPIRWAALSFRAETLRAAVGGDVPRDEDFLFHRDTGGHAALSRLMRDAAALAGEDPMRFALPGVRRALAEEALRASLAAVRGPAADDAASRAIRRRVALVRQAEEVLAAHIGHPLYSDDVEQALGVPMRTLHNAFVAVHGMSAHRYLRLRRLHLARAALRQAPGSASHVKVAALNNGFWHLGRFAQEYRDLFGESPSDTMRRGPRIQQGAQ